MKQNQVIFRVESLSSEFTIALLIICPDASPHISSDIPRVKRTRVHAYDDDAHARRERDANANAKRERDDDAYAYDDVTSWSRAHIGEDDRRVCLAALNRCTRYCTHGNASF